MLTPVLSHFEVALAVNWSAATEVDDEWVEELVNHNVVRLEISM
jgi:hypothetical protein